MVTKTSIYIYKKLIKKTTDKNYSYLETEENNVTEIEEGELK